ncbi:hypothetical protein N7470_006626 [Penicillium chermesinum]|nr:hypothetical protein N7470_006626 [Penicillium chermesinum]
MPPDRERTRIVRVRTGCLTCRRRKKKCDEVHPICGGCVRNDLGCQWPTTIPGRRNSGSPKDIPTDAERRRSSPGGSLEELGIVSIPGSASSRRLSSVSSIGAPSAEGGDLVDLDGATILDAEALHRKASVANSIGNIEEVVASPSMVGHVVPRTLSMLPGYDAESYQLLSHYLSTTADCMANGTTPINPFLVQVVPLAFTSDLLLQLVITQSAAHRAFRRRDESDSLAQSHYTKSIRLFRKGVTDFLDGKEPNPLMLLVGALLMCFTETAKGDMTGTVFDHLSAANSLLVKLLEKSDAAVPRDLKAFVVEYYVYTASVSMISIDARLSGQIFLNFDLEQRARGLLTTNYVGNLCGCWLELLLLIPCIFDLGRQWMTGDSDNHAPTADDFALFASIQAQILRWSPLRFTMLIYLYSSLGGYQFAADGIYKGLIQSAVSEAMNYLEQLLPSARINSGMCWPIAVVGSCLEDPERQETLRLRTRKMATHFGLGNMDRTLQLLEAMWRLPFPEAGPWNISRTMQQHQIWISFA